MIRALGFNSLRNFSVRVFLSVCGVPKRKITSASERFSLKRFLHLKIIIQLSVSSWATAKDPENLDNVSSLDSSSPLRDSEWRKTPLYQQDKSQSVIQSFSISGNTISFESKIFIYPGFEIKIIDELITNFHLPKSTLLMLVSAFAGIDTIKKIYAHAIEQKYRFFSFWDAMWLQKNQ